MQITLDTERLSRADVHSLFDFLIEIIPSPTIAKDDQPDMGVEIAPGVLLSNDGNRFIATEPLVDSLSVTTLSTPAPPPPLFVATQVNHILEPVAPPAPPAPVAGIELDADGMPWDARIHSSTKAMTEKGVWRARRGVNDKGLIARVESELKATKPLPPAAPPQVTAPPPVFTLPPAVTTTPVAPAQAIPSTVAELMKQVGPLLASGKVAATSLQTACESVGVANLQTLMQANQPDLVAAVWFALTA